MKEITQKSVIYKIARVIMCRLLYRVRYENPERMPSDSAVLLCCNHLSDADPIFICAYAPRIARFMAKQELFRIPLLRSVIRALGAFPVDRAHADVSAIRQSVKLLNAGEIVGIFPQGTTHYKGMEPKDTPIKSGLGMIAARTGVPILPVCIQTKGYRAKLFGKVTVRFGELISPEEYGAHGSAATPDEYRRITELAFGRICALLEQ